MAYRLLLLRTKAVSQLIQHNTLSIDSATTVDDDTLRDREMVELAFSPALIATRIRALFGLRSRAGTTWPLTQLEPTAMTLQVYLLEENTGGFFEVSLM